MQQACVTGGGGRGKNPARVTSVHLSIRPPQSWSRRLSGTRKRGGEGKKSKIHPYLVQVSHQMEINIAKGRDGWNSLLARRAIPQTCEQRLWRPTRPQFYNNCRPALCGHGLVLANALACACVSPRRTARGPSGVIQLESSLLRQARLLLLFFFNGAALHFSQSHN